MFINRVAVACLAVSIIPSVRAGEMTRAEKHGWSIPLLFPRDEMEMKWNEMK